MAATPAFAKGAIVIALEDYVFTSPSDKKYTMKKGDTFEITFSNSSTCMVRPSMGGFTKANLFTLAEPDTVVVPRVTAEAKLFTLVEPVVSPPVTINVPKAMTEVPSCPLPTATGGVVTNGQTTSTTLPSLMPLTGRDALPITLSRRELSVLRADAKMGSEAAAIYDRLFPPAPPTFGTIKQMDNFKIGGTTYVKINEFQGMSETAGGMKVETFNASQLVEAVKIAKIKFVAS